MTVSPGTVVTPETYLAARDAAAFIRLEDLGILNISGPDRKAFLQGQLTNDMEALVAGGTMEHCILTPKGRLVGDLTVFDQGADYLILAGTRCIEGIKQSLGLSIQLSDSTLEDVSKKWHKYFFTGPQAEEVLKKSKAGIVLPYGTFGVSGWLLLSETIYEGRVPTPSEGRVPTLDPGTLETLRVESGRAKFGVDMDHTVFPAEANLEHCISYSKGCFLGQETTAYLKNRGHLNRRIVSLKSETEIRPGDTVLSGGEKVGEKVGRVTSVVFSPKFGAYLALAMLKIQYTEPETALLVGDAAVVVADMRAGL